MDAGLNAGDSFKVGDFVLTPNRDLVKVVYLPEDGTIAVESPWSAQWTRYEPEELRHV